MSTQGNNFDPWYHHYAERTSGLSASEVRALFAVASRPEVVSLAGGMPYVSALPTELVSAALERTIRDHGASSLQYGSGQGMPVLREQILDIMALGYVYRVPTPEWQFVMSQAQHAADLRPLQQPCVPIFDPAADFPLLVADATRLSTFATDAVPTVFQLANYTAAITQLDAPIKAAQFAHVRETWASRSSGDDPLAVEAVFPEAVLRQAVGGRRVLKAQLLHLMEVSELPEVSLRVVPHTAAAYPVLSCPFTWLCFPHRQHDDVVYVETFLHSAYVENVAQVKQVAERFSAVQTLALDEAESLDLIADVSTQV